MISSVGMDLYYTAGSAPCRVAMLVSASLGVQLNLKPVNLRAGEHLKPDYLQLNPQHTVPTLVDGDFSIGESRAISRYLINKYDNKAARGIYPQDLKTRALVDQRLDFDLGTLYPRFANFFYPQVFAGKSADEELYQKVKEGLDFFNTFLKGHKYAVGESLTFADLSLVASISTIKEAEISLKLYPRIEKWFELVKATAPGYDEASEEAMANMRSLLAELKANNKYNAYKLVISK